LSESLRLTLIRRRLTSGSGPGFESGEGIRDGIRASEKGAVDIRRKESLMLTLSLLRFDAGSVSPPPSRSGSGEGVRGGVLAPPNETVPIRSKESVRPTLSRLRFRSGSDTGTGSVSVSEVDSNLGEGVRGGVVDSANGTVDILLKESLIPTLTRLRFKPSSVSLSPSPSPSPSNPSPSCNPGSGVRGGVLASPLPPMRLNDSEKLTLTLRACSAAEETVDERDLELGGAGAATSSGSARKSLVLMKACVSFMEFRGGSVVRCSVGDQKGGVA
jgi:hypothetical protein